MPVAPVSGGNPQAAPEPTEGQKAKRAAAAKATEPAQDPPTLDAPIDFDAMTKAEIAKWGDHVGHPISMSHSKDEMIAEAKKAVRAIKRAAG